MTLECAARVIQKNGKSSSSPDYLAAQGSVNRRARSIAIFD